MKPTKSKKFSEPIIFCNKQKNSTVLVVDKATSVRFLEQDTLETLGGFKAKINHVWYKNQVVSFSESGNCFAVITEDAKASRLYDAQTKKIKQQFNRHKGEVTCVAVDPKGEYFFSGGEDGRTFVIDTKSKRLLFTLPHHADYVNDIVFSKKGQLVATASYDKRTHIFNYATITPIATLKIHPDPVMKVHFLSSNILCSVDKKSLAIIWNISEGKVLKRLEGVHDDVVEITSNENFLFLGTALGFIIVYDLKNYEQLSRKFIKVKSRITCLEYDEEQELLVVADELGELLYYDVYTGLDKLKKHINYSDYDKAYKSIDKNPLLRFTKSYEQLEQTWNKAYDKASKLLQNSEKEKAEKILDGFADVASKSSRIKKLFSEYEEFDKFLYLVKSGKIALAYSLANQHPLYKESDVFKALELKWQKLFAKAQKMAADGRSKEQIKEVLHEYRGVSDKTAHIQDMLVKSDIYARFKRSIIKKEFRIVFELIRVNPFLKEFPEYHAIIDYADKLYISTHNYIKSNEIHKALKLLELLVDFPDFRDEAIELKSAIELRNKLYDAIRSSEIADIYKIIDSNDTLLEIPEAQKFNELWFDDFELAKEYAYNADIIGIDGVFEKYKNIPSKYFSISSVYALAYITQIERAIKTNKDKSVIEKAIRSYMLYFGADDYILSTFDFFNDKYDDIKTDIDSLKKGSRKQWRPDMRIENILE